MMKLSNIDTGIHHAIKAQFLAKGASDQDAQAKATQHLGDACKLFHQKIADWRPVARKLSHGKLGKPADELQRQNDPVAKITDAMRAVVTWARAL